MSADERATPLPYWLDTCPVCGGACMMACRCPRNDRLCAKGHCWERGRDGKAIVLDKPHGKPISAAPAERTGE